MRFNHFFTMSILFVMCGFSHAIIANEEPQAEILTTSPELRAKGVGEHYFNFKNFPANVDIIVYTSRLVQNTPGVYAKAGKIRFDDNQSLTINGKTKASIFGLNDLNYLPGERIYYRFAKEDQTLITEVSYVAKPIKAESTKGTFSFEAELIGLMPANYLLIIKGIPENEKIQLVSMTGNQKVKHLLTYNSAVPITIMPGIVGQTNGESVVKINRKSDRASLTLLSGHQLPSKKG